METVITIALCAASLAQTGIAEHQPMLIDARAPSTIIVAQLDIGCCKQWDNRYRGWKVVGNDKSKCETWNAEYDGDDPSLEAGFIWWDSGCQ